MIAFYYLLWVSKYTVKGTRNNTKQLSNSSTKMSQSSRRTTVASSDAYCGMLPRISSHSILHFVWYFLAECSSASPLSASSSKRVKDEGSRLLDSPVATFCFVFREVGIWQTNVHGGKFKKSAKNCNLTDAPRLAWCLKIFKIGKLKSVILFDLLFRVVERGDIVLFK